MSERGGKMSLRDAKSISSLESTEFSRNHSVSCFQFDTRHHTHSPDDGTAFVAGYVSLIAAHLDNEAAAAIRSCNHLVGDDRKKPCSSPAIFR